MDNFTPVSALLGGLVIGTAQPCSDFQRKDFRDQRDSRRPIPARLSRRLGELHFARRYQRSNGLRRLGTRSAFCRDRELCWTARGGRSVGWIRHKARCRMQADTGCAVSVALHRVLWLPPRYFLRWRRLPFSLRVILEVEHGNPVSLHFGTSVRARLDHLPDDKPCEGARFPGRVRPMGPEPLVMVGAVAASALATCWRRVEGHPFLWLVLKFRRDAISISAS